MGGECVILPGCWLYAFISGLGPGMQGAWSLGSSPLGLNPRSSALKMSRTTSYSFGTCSLLVDSFLFLALWTVLSLLVSSLAVCVRSVECWVLSSISEWGFLWRGRGAVDFLHISQSWFCLLFFFLVLILIPMASYLSYFIEVYEVGPELSPFMCLFYRWGKNCAAYSLTVGKLGY